MTPRCHLRLLEAREHLRRAYDSLTAAMHVEIDAGYRSDIGDVQKEVAEPLDSLKAFNLDENIPKPVAPPVPQPHPEPNRPRPYA
jgi:hypothetical protein